MSDTYTLYGMQASLYTGKARAYMRRNQIPTLERGAGHSEYMTKIYPHMDRFIMPVVVTPSGDIVQDGTDILDYFESQGLGREPLYPEDAVTKAVAFLFELFGNEGLLRPAMHYRWNFDDENLNFLKVSFGDVLPFHLDAAGRSAMFDHASGRMRKAAKAFGVFPETIDQIEKSYAEFLRLLNTHLSQSYYLLGNAPTIADYGLFNPLYAHLSRDPRPANIMKTTAPYVWNWVERMNRPEQTQEHTIDNPPQTIFAGDEFPDSLKKLMTYVAEEYLAEFIGHVDYSNQWLSEQEGPIEVVKGPLGRGIGFAEFEWRGQTIKSVVMPYRFYLAQRLWDHFDNCSDDDQNSIRNIFAASGLETMLDKRPTRRVVRENYHEVWAD